MKRNYQDHYRPEKDELDKAYDKAIFILDTNTLLDLYRINPSVTEKALNTIEKYKDRIYITRHTDDEYHRHHYEITAQMCLTVKEVVTHLTPDPFKSKLEEIIKKNSNYDCQFPTDIKKGYFSKLEKVIKEIREDLSGLQGHFRRDFETHSLQHRISDLFNDRVLPGLSEERLKKIIESEGPQRYSKKIPPGYEDSIKATAENDNNMFGDLIIWFEILEYVKKNPVDVFFISRDVKTDWISKIEDMIIGPRLELLIEFRKNAPDNIFHIISLTEFLEKLGKDENFSKDELGSIPASTYEHSFHIDLADIDSSLNRKGKRYSIEDQSGNIGDDNIIDLSTLSQPRSIRDPKRIRIRRSDRIIIPPSLDDSSFDS